MQWFRMWAEFATDVKVQSMDETLQRRFVMFMCLHCSGEYEKLSEEELAFALRITPEQLAETKRVFVAKRFLNEDGKIRSWNKRQYKSDSSTERVQKHRQGKKEQQGNVSVTPSDSDSDSDSDTEAEKKKKAPTEPVAQKRDAGPVERVFDHWRSEFGHPRASLDPKRKRVITAALKAFEEPTLREAISGYRNSPHHMGENEQRTVYDDIELFLRDAKHIEAGLRFARGPPAPALSPVEQARQKLRQSVNGHGRVVSEQSGTSEGSLEQTAGIFR